MVLKKQQLIQDLIVANSGILSYIFNNLKHFTTYSNLSQLLGILLSNSSNTIAISTSTIIFTIYTSTS